MSLEVPFDIRKMRIFVDSQFEAVFSQKSDHVAISCTATGGFKLAYKFLDAFSMAKLMQNDPGHCRPAGPVVFLLIIVAEEGWHARYITCLLVDGQN